MAVVTLPVVASHKHKRAWIALILHCFLTCYRSQQCEKWMSSVAPC
jgi:hypothetical protein